MPSFLFLRGEHFGARKNTFHPALLSAKRLLVPDTRRIDANEIHSALQRVAQEIRSRYSSGQKLVLLGIANGGMVFARRLKALLPNASLGTLDISFHRDDIRQNPIPKEFAPTQIQGDIDQAIVILADDVLFSGRTVKAALDELFDHGRPNKVELAVLVDRGGRRLPISADYCGLTLAAASGERVVVTLDQVDPAKDCILVRSAP